MQICSTPLLPLPPLPLSRRVNAALSLGARGNAVQLGICRSSAVLPSAALIGASRGNAVQLVLRRWWQCCRHQLSLGASRGDAVQLVLERLGLHLRLVQLPAVRDDQLGLRRAVGGAGVRHAADDVKARHHLQQVIQGLSSWGEGEGMEHATMPT